MLLFLVSMSNGGLIGGTNAGGVISGGATSNVGRVASQRGYLRSD
jgi:hypothetical protein